MSLSAAGRARVKRSVYSLVVAALKRHESLHDFAFICTRAFNLQATLPAKYVAQYPAWFAVETMWLAENQRIGAELDKHLDGFDSPLDLPNTRTLAWETLHYMSCAAMAMGDETTGWAIEKVLDDDIDAFWRRVAIVDLTQRHPR